MINKEILQELVYGHQQNARKITIMKSHLLLHITMITLSLLTLNKVTADEVKKIKAHEIGNSYILIGRLGLQLNTSVTLEGKVISRVPFLGLEFEVEKINGKKIDDASIILMLQENKEIDYSKLIDKKIVIEGREVGNLKAIELVNQIDRSKIGNLGCEVKFHGDRLVMNTEK